MKKILFSMALLSAYTTVAWGMKDPETPPPHSSFVQKELPKRSAFDAQDLLLGTPLENTPDTSDHTDLNFINNPQKDADLQENTPIEKEGGTSTPPNTLRGQAPLLTTLAPIGPSFSDSYEKKPFSDDILFFPFPSKDGSILSSVHEARPEKNYFSAPTAPLENPSLRPPCKNFEEELKDLEKIYAQMKKQWEEDSEKLQGLRSQRNTLKEEKVRLTDKKKEKEIVVLKEQNALLGKRLKLGKKLHTFLSRITYLQDQQILFLQANQSLDKPSIDEVNADIIIKLKKNYGDQLGEYHHLTWKFNDFFRELRQWRADYQNKEDTLTRNIEELNQQEEHLFSRIDNLLNNMSTTHRRMTELGIYLSSLLRKQV